MYGRLIYCLTRAWKLWLLTGKPVWQAAETAVERVEQHPALKKAAKAEAKVSFCPRCGQIPTGDRRVEEARELAISLLGSQAYSLGELNLALEWHCFELKP